MAGVDESRYPRRGGHAHAKSRDRINWIQASFRRDVAAREQTPRIPSPIPRSRFSKFLLLDAHSARTHTHTRYTDTGRSNKLIVSTSPPSCLVASRIYHPTYRRFESIERLSLPPPSPSPSFSLLTPFWQSRGKNRYAGMKRTTHELTCG